MAKASYTTYTFDAFDANTFYKLLQFSLYHDLEKEGSSKNVGLSECFFFFTNPKAFSEIFFCLINSIILLTFNQPPNHGSPGTLSMTIDASVDIQ